MTLNVQFSTFNILVEHAMSSIDAKIREALSAEETNLSRELEGDQTMLQMIADSFRGRHRGLVIMVFFMICVYMGLMILSAVRFFAVDEVREMLLWGGLFGFSLLAVTASKIWYWMELNKNSVTRELKRVELRIAQLAEEIKRS